VWTPEGGQSTHQVQKKQFVDNVEMTDITSGEVVDGAEFRTADTDLVIEIIQAMIIQANKAKKKLTAGFRGDKAGRAVDCGRCTEDKAVRNCEQAGLEEASRHHTDNTVQLRDKGAGRSGTRGYRLYECRWLLTEETGLMSVFKPRTTPFRGDGLTSHSGWQRRTDIQDEKEGPTRGISNGTGV
jgi:hypothetical protein